MRMIACSIASILALSAVTVRADESPAPIPAPAFDKPHTAGAVQTAVLSGGCYWGMQGVFEHVRGVKQVVAGFSGLKSSEDDILGRSKSPTEAVQITFDPSQISYGQILQIYFSVAHDPTEVDRQGPDEGPQYRSVIYYSDDSQQKIARAYIAQLGAAKSYKAPIATEVDPLMRFRAVDESQQDYMLKHATSAYVVHEDLPKLAAFRRIYPAFYLDAPIVYSGQTPA